MRCKFFDLHWKRKAFRMENIVNAWTRTKITVNRQWTDQFAWPCVYHFATLTSVSSSLELIFIHPALIFFFLHLIIYNLQRSRWFFIVISNFVIHRNLNSTRISESQVMTCLDLEPTMFRSRLLFRSRPWGLTSFSHFYALRASWDASFSIYIERGRLSGWKI